MYSKIILLGIISIVCIAGTPGKTVWLQKPRRWGRVASSEREAGEGCWAHPQLGPRHWWPFLSPLSGELEEEVTFWVVSPKLIIKNNIKPMHFSKQWMGKTVKILRQRTEVWMEFLHWSIPVHVWLAWLIYDKVIKKKIFNTPNNVNWCKCYSIFVWQTSSCTYTFMYIGVHVSVLFFYCIGSWM